MSDDLTIIKPAKTSLALRSMKNGEMHSLNGEVLVGREIECDITLDSVQISRYHAKIWVAANSIFVEDLHSSNGTYVNGRRVESRTPLSVGDEVAFDEVSFRVTSMHSGDADSTRLTTSQNGRVEDVQKIAAAEHIDSAHSSAALMPDERRSNDRGVEEDNSLSTSADKDLALAASAPRVHEMPDLDELSDDEPPAPSDDIVPDDSTHFLSLKQLDQYVETNKKFQQDFDAGSGPRLIAMTAPIRGKVFSLPTEESVKCWSLGREDSADICLMDASVSREHAFLTKLDAIYQLTSANVVNSVMVNGELCEEANLKHGDLVQIGIFEFVFRLDQKAKKPEPKVKQEASLFSRLGVVLPSAAVGKMQKWGEFKWLVLVKKWLPLIVLVVLVSFILMGIGFAL